MWITILIIALLFTFSWGAFHKSEHNKVLNSWLEIHEDWLRAKSEIRKLKEELKGYSSTD